MSDISEVVIIEAPVQKSSNKATIRNQEKVTLDQWEQFLRYALGIDPIFDDESLVRDILRRCNPRFDFSQRNKYMGELKIFLDLWHFAEDYLPRLYTRPFLVLTALDHFFNERFDTTDIEGMESAVVRYAKTWEKTWGFAMECPICKSPCRRESKLDIYCRQRHDDPAEDIGWACSQGGTNHFWQYKANRLLERLNAKGRLISREEAERLDAEAREHYRRIHAEKEAAIVIESAS